MSKVHGKVKAVVEYRGFCFIKPTQPVPSDYAFDPGEDIFLHMNANGKRLPQKGDIGFFEVGPGKNDPRPRVLSVLKWGSNDNSSGDPVAREPFVHPYNFVSLPAGGLGDAVEVEPFGRGEPASHDRYDSKRFSGHLDCTLTAKTPFFIPDPRKYKREDNEHLWLGYFTLDDFRENWNKQRPEVDPTTPAVPAASLRGMVRNVFEAATLSCLSVFDPSGLDFRIGHAPDARPADPGEDQPEYLPVRFVKYQDEWGVQILHGSAPNDPNNVLPVALVNSYQPKVKYGKKENKKTGHPSGLLPQGIEDGSPVAALISRQYQERWKKRKDGSSFLAYRYRSVTAIVPASKYSTLAAQVSPGTLIVFGYLHRTGPNIENKHHERVFFNWESSYNDPSVGGNLNERYEIFLRDQEDDFDLPVASSIIEATIQSLKGYADRQGADAAKAGPTPRELRVQHEPPYPSDFVVPRPEEVTELESGQLFYALIAKNPQEEAVRGLYPIAMPRLSHDDSRGDLLHHDFHPCENSENLCAACRVFGWVRGTEDVGQKHANEPGRIDACAGHIRFSHGILRGVWDREQKRKVKAVPLAILSSPKPTTTLFYLAKKKDFGRAKQHRWPPALRDKRVVDSNVPLYRQDEATLRGRKFYRRRLLVNPKIDDPIEGGIRRIDLGKGQRDSQNQTVHLLPEDLSFGFRVFFDNLTEQEIGALFFALTLDPPKGWMPRDAQKGEKLYHQIGHGKPLGLGTSTVRVDRLNLDSLDGDDHCYAKLGSFKALPDLSVKVEADQDVANRVRSFVASFGKAWSKIISSEDMRKLRDDLIEMLRIAPDGPTHYPPNPNGRFDENFEWFKENKRQGRELPSPQIEREPRKRLPIKPNNR